MTSPSHPAAVLAVTVLALTVPALAAAQGNAESSALTQQELNQPREPSFVLRERDGTQVTEYRNKGQATDIQVRSGVGTKYEMSKPEDSSPKIRDHDVNRVPSVNLKF